MGEKILIVDDDIDSLKLIGLMLQRQGYEIAAASAGGQAITKAAQEHPDLVILDVMMPDMDGFEVCRRLRADPNTAGIPIIMFTAKTLVDDKVTGFEAGADDYLTKPTHPAELASRVKAILARSAAQRHTAASDSGLMIGFLGAKGGVGTTTIALSVAAMLSQKGPTIVSDIRPGQGSMGLMLGMARATGMTNLLARQAAEINARTIEAELTPHPSGLRALLSSIRPKDTQMNVNPDTTVAILKGMRSLARNVSVDLGSGLTRQTARLVKEIDHLVVIVEPFRVTLNMARELLKELEASGLNKVRASIVLVNRTQSTLQVPWQEAEQLLGHEMLSIVSPAPELAFQAVEANTPMALYQPTSVVATQIGKIAEELSARGSVSAGGVPAF